MKGDVVYFCQLKENMTSFYRKRGPQYLGQRGVLIMLANQTLDIFQYFFLKFEDMLWGAGGFGWMRVAFESGFFNNMCLALNLE